MIIKRKNYGITFIFLVINTPNKDIIIPAIKLGYVTLSLQSVGILKKILATTILEAIIAVIPIPTDKIKDIDRIDEFFSRSMSVINARYKRMFRIEKIANEIM